MLYAAPAGSCRRSPPFLNIVSVFTHTDKTCLFIGERTFPALRITASQGAFCNLGSGVAINTLAEIVIPSPVLYLKFGSLDDLPAIHNVVNFHIVFIIAKIEGEVKMFLFVKTQGFGGFRDTK